MPRSKNQTPTAVHPALNMSELQAAAAAYDAELDQVDALDIANGGLCPKCGARDGIEWNGGKGVDCTYGCHGANGCGEQWDATDPRGAL